jgi:hypothetical protein
MTDEHNRDIFLMGRIIGQGIFIDSTGEEDTYDTFKPVEEAPELSRYQGKCVTISLADGWIDALYDDGFTRDSEGRTDLVPILARLPIDPRCI